MADQMERQNESLRILSDETFKAIGDRLALAARGQTVRGPRGFARFTGLVYCTCGSRCYRVKSTNSKGTYTYYVCGRHQRYDDCRYNAHVREDELVRFVNERFAHIFQHADRIVAMLVTAATAATRQNRADADRIKAELAEVDAEQARLVDLLIDPDVSAVMKRSINTRAAAAEERRALLLAALDGLREQANDNTEKVADGARHIVERARKCLAEASTPAAFNRFVDEFVGPVEKTEAGIVQKQMPPADAEGIVQRSVEGTRLPSSRETSVAALRQWS